MARVFTIVMLLLYASSNAQNVADLESFEKAMKPGTVLTYDVTSGGKTYQMTVTIKKWGDDLSFDWRTNESSLKNGSINVTAAAYNKADALFSVFNAGNATLDKETALCISKKTYSDVLTNAQASVKMAGQTDTVTVMNNTITELNFMLNDNFVSIPMWDLEGGSEIKYTLSVLESQKFPLIVKLNMGWSMLLTSIKTQ